MRAWSFQGDMQQGRKDRPGTGRWRSAGYGYGRGGGEGGRYRVGEGGEEMGGGDGKVGTELDNKLERDNL